MSNVVPFPQDELLERGDQVELAMRLIAEDRARTGVYPVTDEAGAYHVWDDDVGLWSPIDDDALMCRVDEFAGAPIEGAKGPRPLKVKASDANGVATIMRRHTVRPGFFRDDLIAFQNRVVVHVRSNRVLVEELVPEHGARVMMPLDYDDDAWDMPDDALLAHYLDTTFEDRDEQARVMEILGAALLGLGTKLKKAWFLADGPDIDGQGGTGKSQLLELLEGLVPLERRCSVVPQDFADHYHGALLYGKTLNVVFEAPDTDILREEGVKAIVHGETITRRQIRERPITFRPSALHVFSTNRLPRAPGATGAFWDRWEVIEFNRRFRDTVDAIDDLGQKILRDELHHVVHLAVRGACRLLNQGHYTKSRLGTDAIARWRRGADPVSSFVEEWCVEIESDVAASKWSTSTRLYDAYGEWCKARGHNACNFDNFSKRMSNIPHVDRKRSMGASRYRLRPMTHAERGMHHGDVDWEEL